MPNFLVKNPGSGAKLVQVEVASGGKKRPRASQVSIGPGQEREVSLSAEVAQKYAQAGANNPKYLQITALDDAARTAISGQDTTETVGRVPSGDAAGSASTPSAGDSVTARQELHDRAPSMGMDELRTEARMVLGADWPRRGGGDLTREQIQSLLVPKS